MAFLALSSSSSSSSSCPTPCFLQPTKLSSSSTSLSISIKTQVPISITIDYNNHYYSHFIRCSAAKQQQQSSGSSSVKKRRSSEAPAPKKKGSSSSKKIVEVVSSGDNEEEDVRGAIRDFQSPAAAASIPKPPAGFVLDPNDGKVVLVSSKRMVTIVDASNNLPLECIIRRVFRSSQGDDCLLLCPVDTPVQILKSTNVDGWSAVSDEEVEAILPGAAYAFAKIHMHLVYSGFCYTARGGFCYSEEDIFEFGTDDGQDVDGLPTEGVQITCFHQDGTHYMIYTPSDPLLFVAVKDKNGLLRIADDDLLEDSAIVDAIDEETEFNALVEEEAALLESLLEEQ